MARKKSRKLGFKGLANKVTREYRRKGYSAATARKYGNATAGKVAWQKKRKHG